MQPFPLFIGTAINLDVNFKDLYANYKAETAKAPDHFMKIVFPSPGLQYDLKELL